MQLACFYGSSRRNGNSEMLAERVLEGLTVTRLYLTEWNPPAINDLRHTPDGFPPVGDIAGRLLHAALTHDRLMFVTPLYWYGMSGVMKDFFDSWSHALRDKELNFAQRMKGKSAYVIITGGDNPRQKALPLVQQFGHIFEHLGMRFDEYIIGDANRPSEILTDQRALAEAALLNQKLAPLVATA